MQKVNIKTKAKVKPIVMLLIIVSISIIGITIAFFASSTYFENKFRASIYNVSIEEEFYNDWGTKKVNFINKDSTPVVIRVSYSELWNLKNEDSGKVTKKLSNKVNNQDVVEKHWTTSWNSFIDGNDGWYYYPRVLQEGDNLQILESITLNTDLIKDLPSYNDYSTSKYELDFSFESIQATEKAIKDLWGFEVDIKDNTINWIFT